MNLEESEIPYETQRIINILEDITWNGNGRYSKSEMEFIRGLCIRYAKEFDKIDKYNSDLCKELTIKMDKLCLAEKEIKKLKLELEQRVELPCKIGDIVYVTVPFNKPKRINQRTVEGFRLIKGEIFVETNTFSHHISDFGRTVFLNRSVAELKLLEL